MEKNQDIYANCAYGVWKWESGCQPYWQRDWQDDRKKSINKVMNQQLQSSSIQVESIVPVILFFPTTTTTRGQTTS